MEQSKVGRRPSEGDMWGEMKVEDGYQCLLFQRAGSGFIYLFLKIFIYFQRDGKGRRKRKKHLCERETLISCLVHALTRTEPTACALTRNQTCDLSLCKVMLNELSHTGHGRIDNFILDSDLIQFAIIVVLYTKPEVLLAFESLQQQLLGLDQ